jgi:hypothetical protein
MRAAHTAWRVALRGGACDRPPVRGGCHTNSRRGCTGERAWEPSGLLRAVGRRVVSAVAPEAPRWPSGPGDPRRLARYGRWFMCPSHWRPRQSIHRGVRARCPRQGGFEGGPMLFVEGPLSMFQRGVRGAAMTVSCAFLLNPPFGRASTAYTGLHRSPSGLVGLDRTPSLTPVWSSPTLASDVPRPATPS